MPNRRAALAVLTLAILSACSSGDDTGVTGGHGGAGHGGAGGHDAGPSGWHPGVVMPSIGAAGPRGLLDLRGLIHAHSVYSHDACDNAPRDPDTDAIDEPCF